MSTENELTVGRINSLIDCRPPNPFEIRTWTPPAEWAEVSAPDQWLDAIDSLLPQDNYWYLAGPMSNHKAFNYPEFDRVAGLLRQQGYTVVNPAEFEHEDERRRIYESEGTPEPGITPWRDCLARDVVVVANPKCLGIILLSGWETSRGSLLETQVASTLDKPLFEYSDPFTLRLIDRQEALEAYEIVEDQLTLSYLPTLPEDVPPLPADEWWKRQPREWNPLDIRVVD